VAPDPAGVRVVDELRVLVLGVVDVRVLVLGVVDVRVLDDDAAEVRVEGDELRVAEDDSRLTVVVRPEASVLLMVVRMVPDLLTRLSTVVDGTRVVAVLFVAVVAC
jgi:hypothetical protein